MTKDEALRKARQALVSCSVGANPNDPVYWFDGSKVDDAIASINAALSEQASKPELDQLREQNLLLLAVYDAVENYPFITDTLRAALDACKRGDALPVSPLSDERILELARATRISPIRGSMNNCEWLCVTPDLIEFARAILAHGKRGGE